MKKLIYLFAWVPSLLLGLNAECECGDTASELNWCDECKNFDVNQPKPLGSVFSIKVKNDTQDNDPDARWLCLKITGNILPSPQKYFLKFTWETPWVETVNSNDERYYYVEVIREYFGNCISVGTFTYRVPANVYGTNTIQIRKTYTRTGVVLLAHWKNNNPSTGEISDHEEKIGEIHRDNW